MLAFASVWALFFFPLAQIQCFYFTTTNSHNLTSTPRKHKLEPQNTFFIVSDELEVQRSQWNSKYKI